MQILQCVMKVVFSFPYYKKSMYSLKVLFLFVILTLLAGYVQAGAFSVLTKSATYAVDIYNFVKKIFAGTADKPQVWNGQSKAGEVLLISSKVKGRHANYNFMIDNLDGRGIDLATDLIDYISDGNSFNQIMTKIQRNSFFDGFYIQAVTVNGEKIDTVEFCRDRSITTCMNNQDTYIGLFKSVTLKWNENQLRQIDEENTKKTEKYSYDYKCR